MKLTEIELMFIKTCTNDNALDGIFDYENYNEDEFKMVYGLSIKETELAAISLRTKIFNELYKLQLKKRNLKHVR